MKGDGDPNPDPARVDQWWQDRAGRAWAELSDATDHQLDPLGRLALDRLAPAAGERVLDVGCGCGQTVLQLAGAVGPTGQVLGVDISDVMLARASERVSAAAAHQVTLLRADAATHRFAPASVDGIYSRFGVMFFDDPRAAFANLRAALAPAGRMSFVCWQAQEQNPWSLIPLRAARSVLPSAPLPPPLEGGGGPGPFSLADPSVIRDLLATAGFQRVDIAPHATPVHIGAAHTLEAAIDYLMRIGPAARLVGENDPATRPAIRAAITHALTPFSGETGVWLDAAVWLVTARA